MTGAEVSLGSNPSQAEAEQPPLVEPKDVLVRVRQLRKLFNYSSDV